MAVNNNFNLWFILWWIWIWLIWIIWIKKIRKKVKNNNFIKNNNTNNNTNNNIKVSIKNKKKKRTYGKWNIYLINTKWIQKEEIWIWTILSKKKFNWKKQVIIWIMKKYKPKKAIDNKKSFLMIKQQDLNFLNNDNINNNKNVDIIDEFINEKQDIYIDLLNIYEVDKQRLIKKIWKIERDEEYSSILKKKFEQIL